MKCALCSSENIDEVIGFNGDYQEMSCRDCPWHTIKCDDGNGSYYSSFDGKYYRIEEDGQGSMMAVHFGGVA